jgi:hypothetical protein
MAGGEGHCRKILITVIRITWSVVGTALILGGRVPRTLPVQRYGDVTVSVFTLLASQFLLGQICQRGNLGNYTARGSSTTPHHHFHRVEGLAQSKNAERNIDLNHHLQKNLIISTILSSQYSRWSPQRPHRPRSRAAVYPTLHHGSFSLLSSAKGK